MLESLQTSDEVFEIYTEPKIFEDVRDALQAKYDLYSAEITMVPQNTVPVPEDKVEQLQRLIDRLEDEDVCLKYLTSAEFPDEETLIKHRVAIFAALLFYIKIQECQVF